MERTIEAKKNYPEHKVEQVECTGDAPHRISVETDPSGKHVPRITLHDHNEQEVDAESVLCRMEGTMCGCMNFLHNWRNHHKFELISSDNCRWEVEYEVVPE